MALTKHTVFLIALLPLSTTGQVFTDFVIKTRPVKDAIALCPNIGIEKVISDKISIEAEGIWWRRIYAGNGGEGPFGQYYYGKGYGFIVGAKKFIGRNKTAPNAWYFSTQFRYSDKKIENQDIRSFHGGYLRSIDRQWKSAEIAILFGRQFLLFDRVTMDFNFGLGQYWRDYRETFIAGDPGNKFIDGERNEYYIDGRAFSTWTLGYYFTRKKETE